MGNLAHDTANDQRRKEFDARVRQYGRETALGHDALPKLALDVVRAANEGVISPDAPKDGGDDDAARIFKSYADARDDKGVKALADRTANGLKANISKLRSLIKMGVMTKCDPVDVVNRALQIRADAPEGQKVKAAYPALVSVARAQLAADQDLTDDQLKEAVYAAESEEPTVEKILEGMVKKLDKLVTGEGGLNDNSEQVLTARRALKERLAAYVAEAQLREVQEKAAALGLVVGPAAIAA
jgi:hypothetical protein